MAKSAVSGGYEYDFVDEPIPERFLCNICTKVLRDAHLTECCGQHFCDFCLTNRLKEKKRCPNSHCRKKNFVSIINKEKIREINKLRIRCTNREKGCDWVGEMGVLEDHLKSDKGCGYVIAECSNRGKRNELCGKSLERRNLTNHKENECKYRPYTCEYCGHKDTFEGITMGYRRSNAVKVVSHYDRCDHYPLKCPKKCGETNIKRRDMKAHRGKCQLEPLKCPFNAGDCSKDILRKDMESHKRECGYRPYSCGYCDHRGTFRDITGTIWGSSHYDNCDHYPLKCPNECGEKDIKRRDMKAHRGKCQLEPLKCPFNARDCGKSIVRKDMDSHKEECAYRPYSCGYCDHRGTFRDITGTIWGSSHYDNCDHYPLKCPNECGEKDIKRRDMKAHRGKCQLEPLKCPFNAGHKNILRKDMESHKKECDYRPYSCEYCGHRGTFRDIKGIKRGSSHYDKCGHFPLKCPNECSEMNIKRRDMKAHHDICPLEPLDCPFKDAGCSNKILRKDMEKHIESSTQEHLMMVFKCYQELKRENEDLRASVAALQ